jgi:hypothetical protein
VVVKTVWGAINILRVPPSIRVRRMKYGVLIVEYGVIVMLGWMKNIG